MALSIMIFTIRLYIRLMLEMRGIPTRALTITRLPKLMITNAASKKKRYRRILVRNLTRR